MSQEEVMSQDAPKMTDEEEMFAGLEKGLWGKREVEQNTNTNEQFSRRDSMRKELVRKILSYVQ